MTDVQTRTGPEQQATVPGGVPTRRSVLAGAGALGATCLLAACGTDTADETAAPQQPATTQPAAPPAEATTEAPAGGTSTGNEVLAAVADVPEGGGVIKGDYVITQPAKGDFRAFSKICTHQNCPVTEVAGGTINCKCHNSRFSIKDGSVQGGPARKPLPETKVKADGDNIVAL